MPDLTQEILYGDMNSVAKAIIAGADLNVKDRYGLTPLIETVVANKIDIAKMLLKQGAEVDREGFTGKTPLHWAVDHYNLAFCELFLQKGADPNSYAADGQPLLINAILRQQQDLIDLLVKYGGNLYFANNYITTKQVSHRFELLGKVDLADTNNKLIDIEYEGFYLEFTIGILRQSLIDFVASLAASQFKDLRVYLTKIIRILNKAAKLIAHKYMRSEEINKAEIMEELTEDLILIPVTYAGHAITFVKYGNVFVKCDRGVSHVVDTIVINKVGNPYLLTPEFLFDLLYKPQSDKYITQEIKQELQLTPLATLPTRSQLSGNCSWANTESSIPAMLFVLLFAGDTGNKAAVGKLKRRVMSFYRAWVEWDKARRFSYCLERFYAANALNKITQVQLLCSILVQRCNYSKPVELQRAKKIMPIVTMPKYQFILKSYIKMFCHTRLGKISKMGKNFAKVLRECGLDLDNLDLRYPLQLAAANGELLMIKYLLKELKLDLNIQDVNGNTALMYAAWHGHLEVVKYLVAKGARGDIVNQQNGDALAYAKQGGYGDVVVFLKNCDYSF
ncbi:MAG: hypothetical protein COB50_02370 [Thiotrichales bacterium]|nr:MAG: hypothetical protein COB50_02370 [Thiotrichales bacterium]